MKIFAKEQIYEGAKAFGLFLKLLREFPANQLHVPIKNFHNVLFRLKNLENAYSKISKSVRSQVTAGSLIREILAFWV